MSNKKPNKNVNPQVKGKVSTEKLSRREWEDIMGVNRDRYERHNRAIRKK